jgi:RNA-binding protein with serine-rich domain 1
MHSHQSFAAKTRTISPSEMPSSPHEPPRGRSRTRSATPPAAIRQPSPSRSHTPSRSRSSRRTASPRSRSRSRTLSRTPPARNGYRNGRRSGSRSLTRSRSPSRGSGDRRYRERNYSRSMSRERAPKQSSKIVVEKLTKNVTDAHLREIFGSYGEIESLELPMNRQCEYFHLRCFSLAR